jgi:hypothetical protein
MIKMSDIKQDSKSLMDDFVTLRLLLLLSGVGMSVGGAVAGFLWAEIVTNRETINSIPNQIATAIEENSSFQVQQRVRVWDRVDELDKSIVAVDRRQARMEGRIDGLITTLDRIADQLDEINSRELDRE